MLICVDRYTSKILLEHPKAYLVRSPAPLRMMGFTAIGHTGATGRDPCALAIPKIIQQNI
jgi:hypothetical protein